MTEGPIYHITDEKTWRAGLEIGMYEPRGYAQDGFIHCSTRQQVIKVANNRYPGQGGLVLLEIEPGRVASDIRWENLEGGEELFPHVYGKLNLEAVSCVTAMPPQADGSFVFPDHHT